MTPSKDSDVDAARLAHKRALDRKAQNAKRERTRMRIQTLEQQLAACEDNLRDMAREKARLEADNCRLRECIAACPSSTTGGIPRSGDGPAEDTSLVQSISLSPLAEDTMAYAEPQAPPFVPPPEFDALPSPSAALQDLLCRPTPRHLFSVLPCNSPPCCLSDEIMHTFLQSQQAAALLADTKTERPNVLSLIQPATSMHISPILRVTSDVLRAFTDIATLPEQVAGLYLMFRLLNWRVHPTCERYEELPTWLRPLPVQLRIPHPAWMDAIPWPTVRAHLISRQHLYDFDTWSAVYSAGLTVSWPYNPCDAILAVADDVVVASPVFDQHWQALRHWNTSAAFKSTYPEIGRLIDAATRG